MPCWHSQFEGMRVYAFPHPLPLTKHPGNGLPGCLQLPKGIGDACVITTDPRQATGAGLCRMNPITKTTKPQREQLRAKAEALRKRMAARGFLKLSDEVVNQTIRNLTQT